MDTQPSGLLIFLIMFGLILAFIAAIALISWLHTNLTGANVARAARWVWRVAFPAARDLMQDRRRITRAPHLRPRPIRGAHGRFSGSTIVPGEEPRSEGVSATERGVPERSTVPAGTISVPEAAIIAARLTQGMAPGAVAKSLPGYSARNYTEFKAKVDAVRVALAHAQPIGPIEGDTEPMPERRESQPKLGVV